MYDTEMRVKLVKARIKKIQRQNEKRCLLRLSALSVILFASLIGTLYSTAGLEQPVLFGTYGAILLHEDVEGYILVGLLSFSAAVIITLLCIRYKEHLKKHNKTLDEDDRDIE